VTIAFSDMTASPTRTLGSSGRRVSRFFETGSRGVAVAAGGVVILALGGVTVFLTVQGWPAWTAASGLPQNASSLWALAGPLAFGSVWASAIALVLTAPISVGVALFLSEYAPRRVARVLGSVVDVLAAVPSVVFGLWGLMVLAPMLAGPYAWLSAKMGWFPLFSGQSSATGRTILTAAIVLSIMMTPIMASVCREAFTQTPQALREAAIALGSTPWEVIRLAVLPYGRSAMISGCMLALGRALGETMAVAMVLSATPGLVSLQVLTSSNPNTTAAFIAQNFPEAHGMQVSALIALGLVLFAITFVVNAVARRVARPRKEA